MGHFLPMGRDLSTRCLLHKMQRDKLKKVLFYMVVIRGVRESGVVEMSSKTNWLFIYNVLFNLCQFYRFPQLIFE